MPDMLPWHPHWANRVTGMKRDDLSVYVQKLSLAALLVGSGSRSDVDVLFDEALAVRATRRLRELWISRIYELRKLDSKAIPDNGELGFAKHCPPSFALTKNTARPCRQHHICPFCWARRVAKFYRQAEVALYGTAQRLCLNADTRQVGEVRPLGVDIYEILDQSAFPADGALAAEVKKWSEQMKTRYRVFGKSSIGGLIRVNFSPEGISGYDVTRRSLIVVPVGSVNRKDNLVTNAPTTRLTKYPVDRRELAACIGRVLQYPTGLLTENAGLVMNLLTVLKKGRGRSPRLQASYGILRNSKSREDEDENTIHDVFE